MEKLYEKRTKRIKKNSEKAFVEYPIEEEWHKGKVENVLNEQILLKKGKGDKEKIEEYKRNFYNNLNKNL